MLAVGWAKARSAVPTRVFHPAPIRTARARRWTVRVERHVRSVRAFAHPTAARIFDCQRTDQPTLCRPLAWVGRGVGPSLLPSSLPPPRGGWRADKALGPDCSGPARLLPGDPVASRAWRMCEMRPRLAARHAVSFRFRVSRRPDRPEALVPRSGCPAAARGCGCVGHARGYRIPSHPDDAS